MEEFDGFLDYVVVLVDDGEVFAHVPEVACHESFDDELYVVDGFLPFFFVFWSDVLFLSFGKDVVDDFLWHLEVVFELLEGGVCFREFLSVFVYVSEVCVDDDAFGRQFSVAFGVAHGVEWDEVVWHDATASVDGSAFSECLIAQ